MNFDTNKYELIQHQTIEELKSEGYLLKHKKSGARIAIMSNDDDNKVFAIGFRTPPPDSTGVPHILEHSVLCGSDKYPVKDPFIELAKGSLNTFLNAITYPDKTVYPIASTNDADFKNLMDVYMDAALHPLIGSRKEVFLQEGWHYEMENADAPLTYNGVVYNEMKGAFSSPDDVLSRYCVNSLYPDTSYGTESGGDPKNIPDLTYENFVNFHKKLYHPANSYIYIYGDCDMEERLEYLDREYLSAYDAITVDSELKTQAPFTESHHVEVNYSVTEEEGTENKSYLAYNFSIGDVLDLETVFSFSMIDYALFSSPGAPVKQALIDAGIGSDVSASFEDSIKQPMLSITVKEADPSREDEFIRIVRDTLTQIVKDGINEQTLLAGINSEEFRYREADFGRFPKGLMYFLNMMSTWLYDENRPFDRVALNDCFAFLKSKLGTGYYEELIRKYLLDNPHSSIVVLNPEIGLASKNEAELADKLAAYKATLSAQEIQDIVEQTAALKAYQSEPSTEEELAKIPLLSREDIRREVLPLYNDLQEIEGVTVDHHNVYTNGIGYLTMCFNIQNVADEDLPYVGILGNCMGYIDTDTHSFEEFSSEMDIHTGGVYPDFSIYQSHADMSKFTAMFQVRAKALVTKFDKVFALSREMMFTSHYDDYKRLKEILAEVKAQMQGRFVGAGHGSAVGILSSQMDEGGKISSMTSGLPYYYFLTDILEHFEEKKEIVAQKLNEITKLIFTKENMIVSLTAADEQYETVKAELAKFVHTIPEEHHAAVTRHFVYEKKKIGIKTAGQVNYVAVGGNFIKKGLEFNPSLGALKTILGYDYLWNNIRVLGGAYGCMNNFSSFGKGYFVSYRDPNCKKTVQVYEGIADYVENFDVSEREMTKYIIGTFSDMDTPLTPSAQGVRSFEAYLREVDIEELQRIRDGVLNTTVEDIRSLGQHVRAIMDEDYLVVVGSADAIERDADLFEEIITFA